MNIVFLNIYSMINTKGGVEKVFCDLASHFAEKNFVTAIFNDKKNGNILFDINENVKVVNLHDKSKSPIFKNTLINIKAFSFDKKTRDINRVTQKATLLKNKLERELGDRINEVDVFIAFQPEATLALKQLVGNTIPIVTMLHGTPEIYPLLKLFPDIIGKSIIQVLRPEYASVVKKIITQAEVVYIPNPVNKSNHHVNHENKLIINVGRISEQKQQIFLVKAFKVIHDEFPDWRLEIWGDVTTDKQYVLELKRVIDKLSIGEYVKLCGTTDNICKQLNKASIFAFPSKYEGFPLALAEAMAAGLCVIGRIDCPGVNSIIENHKNGILAKNDVIDYADSLKKLIMNKELRHSLGNKAQADMEQYNPQEVYNKWDALINKLVNTEYNKIK